MRTPSNVIVIGGGLIGLAIADELARRGREVRVLQRHAPRDTASWAGAGMLTPHPERAWHTGFEQLALRSFELYPPFVASLIERTDIDPELRMDGVLIVASSESAAERLRHRVHEWEEGTVEARWLDGLEARELEPAFGTPPHGAVLVAAGGSIDNRRLLTALEVACRASGVVIEKDVTDVRVAVERDRVSGVYTQSAYFTAPTVVNAAGAWAGLVPGIPSVVAIPITPVKGQMLALESNLPPLQRVTWVDDAYFVPRNGGRLLVGATHEHVGFDPRITANAMHGLLDATLRQFPHLANATLVETWAGFRPGTPDGLPFLGPTSIDGYITACGHYRNGILLTPITAFLIADLVDGKHVELDESFLPGPRSPVMHASIDF